MRYQFADPIIEDITAQLDAAPDVERMRETLADVRSFLRRRLTEAARMGCHHCGEQEDPRIQPCVWCGLKGLPE